MAGFLSPAKVWVLVALALNMFLQPSVALGGNSIPPVSGNYTSSKEHPRVFMTPEYLKDLVIRINTIGTYSSKNFVKLAKIVKSDLAQKVDWSATYSGCDIDMYLLAFSFESRHSYASDMRSEDQINSALHVRPGLSAPAGAAIVASRLALYATLVKMGAHVAPDFPPPDQAIAVAKQILISWAARGFRDQNGNFINSAQQFCKNGESNRIISSTTGLQIGRGVVYSVQAQDLLQSIGAFNKEELAKVNQFHSAMYDLIHEAANFAFFLPYGPDSVCDVYSNHKGVHIMSLLAIARLFDDGRRFDAVLYGNDPGSPMKLPWINYFDHAIYGNYDRPIICYKNPGPDSLTSHPSYQTSIVAPGEVEDRYRHGTQDQAFGYTNMALANLYNIGHIMGNSGFDAFNYQGAHQQSIEMATDYYACYAKNVGINNIVTAENAHACPDYQEYIGQKVSAESYSTYLMGAYHFPQDTAIAEQETAAKAKQPVDPLQFGRWRD